ncbi:MAG: hypothetical protein IPL90_13105 [Holophagales bacterium]|nr:hypothetical protein [Holophagales bacterium]
MFRTRTLVALLLLALAGLLAALGREGQRETTLGRGPDRAGGKVERCVTCHVRPEEDPGGAHARAAVGCSSCHLGNELAFDKARAHAGMEAEPGALRTVSRTCGRAGCHVREAQRVATSLMARASGIVSVDRWVFGEIPQPRGAATMRETLAKADPSPAERHLGKLCAGCHLHALRGNRDDAIHGNGSGCSSCHVARRLPGAVPRPHPAVDARVTDDRCLGCHSRSGRIALTYEGLYEVEKDQAGACGDAATTLHDGRPACRAEADVHRLAGLSCVDCHLHTDLMGDGREWEHEEDQVEITCEACHGPVRGGSAGTETTWGEVTDPISRDLLRQRGETRPPEEHVRLGRRGTPVWNLRPSGDGWVTFRKGQGVALATKQTPIDANHVLPGHERLTCSSCHAAWAPTCSTCHTAFDASGKQWDFAKAVETPGRWVETSEGYAARPPALAVRADGRIAPAMPGMVMDLDATSAGGPRASRRLFASLDPHSTGKKARSCESCHLSSWALGLGTGTLDLSGAEPAFTPPAPAAEDARMASDAWTHLDAEHPGAGTRVDLRSLDAKELRRTLAVGACLPCHRDGRDPVYRDFEQAKSRLAAGGTRCAFGNRGG